MRDLGAAGVGFFSLHVGSGLSLRAAKMRPPGALARLLSLKGLFRLGGILWAR